MVGELVFHRVEPRVHVCGVLGVSKAQGTATFGEAWTVSMVASGVAALVGMLLSMVLFFVIDPTCLNCSWTCRWTKAVR